MDGKRIGIVYKNIDDLKAYDKNPRRNDASVDKVAMSIKEYGFKVPVVIDKDGVIIAGHTRVKGARKLRMKEVPCIVADDLSEAQAKAFRIADNRVGEASEWDMDLLSEELEALKGLDFDISLTGFDEADIQLPQEDAVDDDFEPEPPEEPVTRPGDIWHLGRHRLICGDSTDPEVVQKLTGGQMADLYLTDPPYNVDYEGKAGKIQNDSLVLGRQDYQWSHEPCLYGWNDGGSHAWYSDRKQTTVLEFDRPSKSKLHPTMKPIPLFDYLIKNSSKAGDVVLDSFGGSGTTIMACEQDGRTGCSCELDPKYADVIVQRYVAWKKGDGDVFLERDGEMIAHREVRIWDVEPARQEKQAGMGAIIR